MLIKALVHRCKTQYSVSLVFPPQSAVLQAEWPNGPRGELQAWIERLASLAQLGNIFRKMS